MSGALDLFIESLLVVLVAAGCFFALVGSWGLVKLGDFFKRLHGPTKASTLGVGCILLASIGYHAYLGDDPQPRELLVTVFLFITAPISAHLMAKAALSLMPGTRPHPPADAKLPDITLPGEPGFDHEAGDDTAEPGPDRPRNPDHSRDR